MAAPSPRKKNLSLAAIVLLLSVVATTPDTCGAARARASGVLKHAEAEKASVAGDTTYCWHPSGTYFGWCNIFNGNGCNETCMNEGWGNIGGACSGFPPKCYCISKCKP